MYDRARNLTLDTIIAGPTAAVLGVVLSKVELMTTTTAIVCGLLSFVAIFGLLVRSRSLASDRMNQRMEYYLGQLPKIPPSTADDPAWESWLAGIEGALRGAGQLRKSQVLSRMIRRADANDRPMIAESFFRGLAHEAATSLPAQN